MLALKSLSLQLPTLQDASRQRRQDQIKLMCIATNFTAIGSDLTRNNQFFSLQARFSKIKYCIVNDSDRENRICLNLSEHTW